MSRFDKEPHEEEEIPPFLEALAISWGHPIPNSNYYSSDSSANSSRKNEQTRHESLVNKINSRMSDYEEQDSPIMNRYASKCLTQDTSHTVEPSEASSHIRSTPYQAIITQHSSRTVSSHEATTHYRQLAHISTPAITQQEAHQSTTQTPHVFSHGQAKASGQKQTSTSKRARKILP